MIKPNGFGVVAMVGNPTGRAPRRTGCKIYISKAPKRRRGGEQAAPLDITRRLDIYRSQRRYELTDATPRQRRRLVRKHVRQFLGSA